MNKKVAIVGLGLMGGSLALSLKGKVDKLVALDLNKEVVDLALEKKIVEECSIDPKILQDCDIIIMCIYPQQIPKFLRDEKHNISEGALILDIGGLKEEIVVKAQNILAGRNEFVGTHPMAGREERGLKLAKEELFLGTNLIITPTDQNTKENLTMVEELFSMVGVGKISYMEPVVHDKLIGTISHIPHIIAMAQLRDFPREYKDYIGGSFKDGTRVGKMNEDLWASIFLANKDNLVKDIKNLRENLKTIEVLIENGDEEGLKEYICLSSERKKEIDNDC